MLGWQYIYISNNSGNSWIEVTSTGGGKQWRGIAMSSDGIKIIAAVWNGNIWTSTVNDNADVDDSVYVWTENTLTGVERNWEAMAMSSDGKIIAAATYGGNIWISNDSGVRWTEITVGDGTLTYGQLFILVLLLQRMVQKWRLSVRMVIFGHQIIGV